MLICSQEILICSQEFLICSQEIVWKLLVLCAKVIFIYPSHFNIPMFPLSVCFLFIFQGATFGTLLVFDRDLTTTYPEEDSHNKYVGTLLNSEKWVKDTFNIKGVFSEKKAAIGGIRESVNTYRE